MPEWRSTTPSGDTPETIRDDAATSANTPETNTSDAAPTGNAPETDTSDAAPSRDTPESKLALKLLIIFSIDWALDQCNNKVDN